MQLSLTPLGTAGVQVLAPDIVWLGQSGDFAMASDPDAAGGFQASAPIESAILMLLFSDMRAGAAEVARIMLGNNSGDRRGWVGDGFDIDTAAGEAPLGSLFWLLRRRALTELTGPEIEAEARRALNPLIVQQVVARIDTRSQIQGPQGQAWLGIDLFGRDGSKMYAGRFDLLWQKPPPW